MNIDETRTRILAAAAALFAERGYAATTTRSIAEAAGVNEVTLFRRFGTKEGLVRALIDAGAASRRGDPEPADMVPDDLAATLLAMAEREIADAAENGALAVRLAFDARSVPEIRDALGDTLPNRMRRFAEFLRRFQEDGTLRDDLPAEAIAEAFFALTSSLVMYRIAIGTLEHLDAQQAKRAAGQLVAIFWNGAARHPQEEG